MIVVAHVAAAACAATPGRVGPPPIKLDAHGYIAALATGDQRAFERWVRQAWDAASLTETGPEDRASQMARTFTDTGGFDVERVAGEQPGWVQLEVRARRTAIAYCVTMQRTEARITDVTVTDPYPAGPGLSDPEPSEVVECIRRLGDAYTRAGEFSGQILIERNGTVYFRAAYGATDLAHGQPVTLATRFSGASIGKSLTAVAIAQLVESG